MSVMQRRGVCVEGEREAEREGREGGREGGEGGRERGKHVQKKAPSLEGGREVTK